jgi:competence ComEA-like helix-hairpin-helix protein
MQILAPASVVMLDLTPQERRGALVVLSLFVIGTLWDLAHVEPRMAPPLPVALEVPATAAVDAGERAPGAAAAPMPPATAMPAAPAAGHRGKSPPSQPLPLASASAQDLAKLPGIGPVLAQRIVDRRERVGGFHSVDDLLSVPGIGPRLFERIRPWLRAGGDVRSARPK